MSAEQNVVNAQVDVNRAVWALNMESQVDDYKHKTFKSDRERDKYIIKCCQDAVKSLKAASLEYGQRGGRIYLKKVREIMETNEEKLNRLEEMLKDDYCKWDLSVNDLNAVRYGIRCIKALNTIIHTSKELDIDNLIID